MGSHILRIFLFLLLSAVIAYTGDYVGYRAGRLKISLFGFRPRKTSRIIAVATGVLITIITLSLLLIFSREAQIALFELEKLENEIETLRTTRISLKNEIYNLSHEKEEYEAGVGYMRFGMSIYPVIYSSDQPLKYVLLKKGTQEQDVRLTLNTAVEEIKEDFYRENEDKALVIANKLDIVPLKLKGNIIFIKSEDYITHSQNPYSLVPYFRTEFDEEFVNKLSNSEFDQIVKFYAVSNTFLGDDLLLDYNVTDEKLIFFKGQSITESTVDSLQDREDILNFLLLLLGDVQEKALEKGMIEDPEKGLGVDIPNTYLWDLCDEIIASSSKVKVSVIAKEDIFTLGPLKFDINIETAE